VANGLRVGSKQSELKRDARKYTVKYVRVLHGANKGEHRARLQSLDLGARTLRLHDNIIWYLRDKIGAEGCRAAHAVMAQAIGARCSDGWETLPPADAYGWRFLIRHLRGACRICGVP
jgi:hypothetical protein